MAAASRRLNRLAAEFDLRQPSAYDKVITTHSPVTSVWAPGVPGSNGPGRPNLY